MRNILILSMLIVLLGILYGNALWSDAGPVATEGVMDLAGDDFSSVKLRGEWEFYWQQLLTPEDFASQRVPRAEHFMDLPRSWNGYVWEGQTLSGEGYATFRLNIRLDPQDVDRHFAFWMPIIFNSYKMWINGELLAEAGTVGIDQDSAVPSIATRFIAFKPATDQVEIVIQAANFHHMRGGITRHIEFGDYQEVWKKRVTKYTVEIFIAASLFVIGIYHLLLYAQRRKDKAPLYFGLFTVGWFIRSLVVGELPLTQVFPQFPWELQLKMEYLVVYLGLFIFTMYFYHLFKEETPYWFRVASGVLAATFSLLVVVAPAKVFTRTLTAYEMVIAGHVAYFLYALLKAAKRRKEGAVVFLIFSSISALMVINDFLYYSGLVLIGSFSVFGMFIFTFAQMYLLSSRFAKAEAEVERSAHQLAEANEQLVELNKNLEQKVLERTRELKMANERLSQAYDRLLRAEEGRKKLLSYISHDLKAPLSTMLGYVEAVQDNIKPERHSVYLNYIHQQISWLNRLIEDLSLLSHLETHQVTFDMEPLFIEEFVRQFWNKYEPVIMEAGLRSELKILPPPGGEVLQVMADPVRMEQALSNLLSNAMKFTPAGGAVTLVLAYREMDGVLHAVISLTDTGIGIPPERLELIFERNYKRYPDGFEQRTTGSGLGLAITREIVEAHHGKIWAESEEANGSTFFIAIPVLTEDNLKDEPLWGEAG